MENLVRGVGLGDHEGLAFVDDLALQFLPEGFLESRRFRRAGERLAASHSGLCAHSNTPVVSR
jgi:hypothetical protein